jgi:hypothetical protein
MPMVAVVVAAPVAVVRATWTAPTSPPTKKRRGNLRRTAQTPTTWTPTLMGEHVRT